ncbi:hypothetical protein [Allomuricauda sp.]|uniref:hypothetical protein n=1 Tax=Flagellimonas alginolytica TaxID=3177515 RepID=UPI0025E4E130|nr:hypothetical protein [Allomuricauda sp.]
MKRFRRMLVYLGLLFIGVVGLWYMVLTRKINPDAYFLQYIGPIDVTHVYVGHSSGGLRISPELENNFRPTSNRKIQYSINNGYSLYNDEYNFELDSKDTFKLIQLRDGKSLALGTVIEKTFLEYSNSYLYKIRIPDSYTATHEYARGIFPYYVPVQFTMMTSGGMKYSSETITKVLSPLGDSLILYTSSGHITPREKTGIRNSN